MRSVILVALALAACSRSDSVEARGDAALIQRDPTPEAPPRIEAKTVELQMPGYAPAMAKAPGSGAKKPVVVATHGAWDRPDYHCSLWQRYVGDRAFVVCPRGKIANKGVPADQELFFYGDHLQLGAEVKAALAALQKQYPDQVDLEAPLYTGFSQGAIQGAWMLPRHPGKFAYAVLVEGGHGGYNEWGPGVAAEYAKNGGKRVVLACGREACQTKARRAAEYLEKAGIQTRIVYVEGAGHSYGGGMEEAVRTAFEWAVEDDERFAK
jgi:predicted esterase